MSLEKSNDIFNCGECGLRIGQIECVYTHHCLEDYADSGNLELEGRWVYIKSQDAVVLAALLPWTIFANLDLGIATVLATEVNDEITRINPELSLRPVLPRNGTLTSSRPLISYKPLERETYYPWVQSMDAFLAAYRRPDLLPGRLMNILACSYDYPPPSGQVCDIDVRSFGPCSAENNFSYNKSAPCIFLKLDTPSGWRPEFYNDTNLLPETMPQYLKDHIKHSDQMRPYELNTVWISCEGDNIGDTEKIGPIRFFPSMGIPGYYYLNDDVEGYLSPVIAVNFERPRVGVLINITCKAWARNIQHNDSALGGVKFALLIDQ